MSKTAENLFLLIIHNMKGVWLPTFLFHEGYIGNYPTTFDGSYHGFNNNYRTRASINIDNTIYGVGKRFTPVYHGDEFVWISKEISETDWVKIKLASCL